MNLCGTMYMKPIEIYFDRKHLWRIALLAIGIIIGFGILAITLNEIGMYIVFGLLCGLSCFVLKFALQRLRNIDKPALIIDEEGLVDYTNALSIGRIEWGQIREFNFNRELRSIAILLKEPNLFIKRQQGLVQKGILWLNWKLDSSPFHINDRLLKLSFEELVQAIESRQWGGMPFHDFIEHLIDDE